MGAYLRTLRFFDKPSSDQLPLRLTISRIALATVACSSRRRLRTSCELRFGMGLSGVVYMRETPRKGPRTILTRRP